MQAGDFRGFTHLEVLNGIGRNLLDRFLESFTPDLAAGNIQLPKPETPDPEYFQAVALIFARPEALPGRLAEALFAIEEMSDPRCRDQINSALAALQPSTPPLPNSTTRIREDPESLPEHFATQAWLAVPTLLARLETYTLDPIQEQRQDALAVDGFHPLRKATLRETQAVSNNLFQLVTITRADDVFRAACA